MGYAPGLRIIWDISFLTRQYQKKRAQLRKKRIQVRRCMLYELRGWCYTKAEGLPKKPVLAYIPTRRLLKLQSQVAKQVGVCLWLRLFQKNNGPFCLPQEGPVGGSPLLPSQLRGTSEENNPVVNKALDLKFYCTFSRVRTTWCGRPVH